MEAKAQIERRQEKRLRVKSGALIMLKPPDAGIGRLIGISMGGLTFEHLTSQSAPFQATELDILITGSGFRLQDIPCKSIWNLAMYEKPLAPLYKTRYGVQFGALTPVQIRLLEYLVQNHTTGEID
jgi:hypothetical protein